MKNIQTIFVSTKKQHGSALILVVILLFVSSILVASAAMMTQANTAMTSLQEQGIRSYYIARSGAELAYEVIYSNNDLYTQFRTNDQLLSESITFTEGGIVTGNADVVIESYDGDNGKTLQISSTGIAAGTDHSKTAVLIIDNMEKEGDFWWAQ
ncbi:hypothetical protein [Anoxynatronum buryatiense]|uniref:Type 4 fimbrial biogenesis protein PilX N-terminal domain-containing protein n=1 Tax=Anoxynatronum buryatiense TaxID=489973 RepID=A0AA46AID7_9CLOT|nr:hypothetical protein [Anoxynatronum buryatiense]SMP48795.1 hypothetical protein SAMN06296020_103282 [Anoxynatronum buryatiense]